MATLVKLLVTSLLLSSQMLRASDLVFNTYIDPPYVSQGDEGVTGISIDILKLLRQHSQLNIELHLLPLKRAYAVALDSANQCVFAIERTQSRESSFIWISPMFISRYAIYQRKLHAKHLASLDDLTKLRIGSYSGSGVGEYLTSFSITVDLAKTNLNSAKKLTRHRTGAWASDILSAAYIAQQFDLDISPKKYHFYSALRAIACNKNSDLGVLDKLQKSLNQLQKSGQIGQVLSKYEQQYQVDLGL
ncbi:substrate-binding periplasmic protein [Agarivorans sp. DSG3-1]|uniref:substrate-binding periplasmic protein n=1 Tax=Agarivorans sp. DSG3-1 TaxID=3342249 RepID=UPI00398E6A94